MKAAWLADYGSADNFSIGDAPRPELKPDQVLIKVEYAGLRWGDIMGRRGIPVRAAKPPFIPGQEAAGVIVEVGEAVRGFAVGDRVTALPYGGAYAEYLAMTTERLEKAPDHAPLDALLAYRVNMPTAYLAVYEWTKVQEGEIVLVHAAAGGVGQLIVQILKRRFQNVTVIGLAGSDEKVEAVRANGADHAINYKSRDYVQAVGEIAGAKPEGFAPGARPAGVHVVMNGVGGPTLQTDRKVIRRLGRWLLFGTPAGAGSINPFEYAYDSITILPFSMIPFAGTPEMARAQAFTRDWIAKEDLLQPTVRPIEEVAAAQLAMERGETIGKVVFKI